MNVSGTQNLRTQIIILSVISFVPLSNIWVRLPQSITLLSLGVLCLLGSFVSKWFIRNKADSLGEHLKVQMESQFLTPDVQPRIDVAAPITSVSSAISLSLPPAITNAFSIDLEDYFHTEVACKVVHHSAWDAMPSCIERSTMELLDILDRTNTRATIFVLGWIARKQPHLVRHIQDRGHELACHSNLHRRVHSLSPAEFLEDTRIARDTIQDAGGYRIQGYRAPSFSITEGTEWAFDILADLGFTYDSSVYPISHPTYGNPKGMRFPYYIADCKLLEIPVATWRVSGINLPVGGGAYMRVLPERYIDAGVRAINEVDREPAMLYIHPWEIDPMQPRLKLNTISQLRQTFGLNTMAAKLESILARHKFAPINEVYAHLIPQWHAGLIHSLPIEEAVEVHV